MNKYKYLITGFIIGAFLFVGSSALAYTVTLNSGETLWQYFGSSWKSIADQNGITNPNNIPAGTVLQVDEYQEPRLGGTVTKPYTFSPNTTIRSSEINSNFDTLYTLVNGNISNTNINASAAIGASKISGTAIVSTPSASQTITGTTTINGLTTIGGGLIVTTTEGTVRVPSMTNTQRDALSAANGDIIYSTTDGQFYIYEGGTWDGISPAAETALATTTGKGIVELGTGAEAASNAAYGSGSTDAGLVIHTGITSSTAGLNIVPVTNASSVLDSSFGGSADSLATLDSNSLVVQNPANATTTPTAGALPIAKSDTLLNPSWIATSTATGSIIYNDGTNFKNLGIGASTQVLDSSGTAPQWIIPYATGQATRLGGAGTGSQNIAHGLGRIPKMVIIQAYAQCNRNAEDINICQSYGTATSTTNESSIATTMSPGTANDYFVGTSTTNIIALYNHNQTAFDVAASLATLDAANITLSFDTMAAIVGTVVMQWTAY
jgi:hypothetical protein